MKYRCMEKQGMVLMSIPVDGCRCARRVGTVWAWGWPTTAWASTSWPSPVPPRKVR